jgi:hypothetical protein
MSREEHVKGPLPPLVYALPTLGIWLLIGVVILIVMRARGKEEWLDKAGESAFEVPESHISQASAQGSS